MDFSYPQSVRFQCQRCAVCCGDTETRVRHILLLSSEAKRISNETLKPINEIAIRVAGHEPYVFEMKKTKQGKCIFLEGDECRIYVLRPLVCRFYPFELKTPEGGVHEFGYTEECKGIGVGKRVGKAFFEELFRLVNSRLQEDQSLCR